MTHPFETSMKPTGLMKSVIENFPQTRDCYDIAFHFKIEPNHTRFKLLTLIYKTADKKPHTILKGNVPYSLRIEKDEILRRFPKPLPKYCALVIRNNICSYHKKGLRRTLEYYPFEIRNVKPDMEKYLDTLA